MKPSPWIARFRPAPDSSAARTIERGKSPWTDAVHLLWSVWIFVTPAFADGYTVRWAALTALSYPCFLLLFVLSTMAPRREAARYPLGMAAMAFALLPWYPSGISYFIYGCVMLQRGCVPLWRHLGRLLCLCAVFVAECLVLHYPWGVIVSAPVTAMIIALTIDAESSHQERDAALRLSQEEIRRLAATAERERIGRDLHDLLGHTLSLITLKLELSRKLFERDAGSARREVAEAEKVARHALAEVRAAVSGIRSTDIAAEFASARLLLEASLVHVRYTPPPPLPADVERALALVVREAATNIARHADASMASIALTREPGRACLDIRDDGRGGVTSDGNGLCGMRERVIALGGTLRIESPRGRGTRLRVCIPLDESPRTEPEAPRMLGSVA